MKKSGVKVSGVKVSGGSLFSLGVGSYVQWNVGDKMPDSIKKFESTNGFLPASIPLPSKPTTFQIGNKLVAWNSHGRLPTTVMAYVKEHGYFPRHTK